MERIESTILSGLIFNENYYRKVVPFLKTEYFSEPDDKIIFEEIKNFSHQYKEVPTQQILHIEVERRDDLSEELFKRISEKISSFSKTDSELQWMIDATEKWCKDRAIYNALMESIKIADGKDEKQKRDAIPDILKSALSVSFDEHIGHDYFDNFLERYDYYHLEEDKIPFDLEMFNKITKGGLPNKTLNIVLAGTGVGKSLFMCHHAASCIAQGKNVLYITLEMAEEKIAERIDANLLNWNIRDISDIPKIQFTTMLQNLSKKTQGKLIIKEYPTASAHAGHFKSLLNELSLKKSFKPDIIFIDYLNICASSRYKGHIVNSYTYVKAIAEELRGLAVENNVPIVSATQTTRSGYGNTDVDLTDTSESFGLPATADFMFALISTEDLERDGNIMVKQLKNRYNDPTMFRKFLIGVDRSKMKLYHVQETSQNLIPDDADEIEDLSTFNAKTFSDFIV
jgi:replicative DNA helicase